MHARDDPGDGELDISGSDTSRELTIAEDSADRWQPLSLVETRNRGEVYAELRQRAEGGWEPRRFGVPRAELRRFDPERVALPPTTLEGAASYVEQHRDARPWLMAADTASPEARRILAAMDAGGGHAHIRHEGWVTEEASMRRVAYREDPA